MDQVAAAEGISRTEFILRCCLERALDVLLDRPLFSQMPEQNDPAGGSGGSRCCRSGSGQHRAQANDCLISARALLVHAIDEQDVDDAAL
jgi:hypothetical protein